LMNGANSNEDNPSGIQGVCPDGWHIPSNPEWTQLSDYLGGYSIAGGKLKEPGAAHWIDPNTAATNESGFTALPGGLRSPDGSFSQMGEYGWWWACSEYKGDGVLRRLQYDDAEIYSGWTTNLPGYSVRCVEGQGYNVPAVTTTSVTNMTINSAEAGGIVTDDGGQPVTERGICWSTGTDPTIYNDKTSDGGGSGSFSGSLTGLSEFTVYYIRAYATNSVGTGYGEELSFRTSTVTDYDGNVYRIVQIGDQLWMAENLRAFHYADGTPIPLVESTAAWDNMEGSDKAYCWYENSIAYRNAFGGLYTWAAAMNGAGSSNTNPSGVQGVCPTGWHLPSDEEWKQLEIYIEMSQAEADSEGWRGTDQGGRLKESGYAHWQFPNTGASDQYGFTALPGGYRQTNGTFSSIGNYGFWHSSALYGGIFVWYRTLDYNDPRIGRYSGDTKTGNSIRCLKD
jgi:uncharacterized protein (TIGR02145 family)